MEEGSDRVAYNSPLELENTAFQRPGLALLAAQVNVLETLGQSR